MRVYAHLVPGIRPTGRRSETSCSGLETTPRTTTNEHLGFSTRSLATSFAISLEVAPRTGKGKCAADDHCLVLVRCIENFDLRVIDPRFILATTKRASFGSSSLYRTTRDGSRRYQRSRRAVDAVTFGCTAPRRRRDRLQNRGRCVRHRCVRHHFRHHSGSKHPSTQRAGARAPALTCDFSWWRGRI
jgi:hypothetical protein